MAAAGDLEKALDLRVSTALVLPLTDEGCQLIASITRLENESKSGKSLERTVVTLRTQNRSVAETHTNNWGQFVVGGLRGGVYELASADHSGVYRLWTEGTAPPSASPHAVLVAAANVQTPDGPPAPVAQAAQQFSPAYAGRTGGLLTRGPAGRVLRIMANNPGLTAVGVASAVAIPTSLDKRED